jgi:hypothetical protein
MSTPTPIADIEIFRHAQNLVTSRSYARSQTPLKPLRPSQIRLVPTNLRVGPLKRQRQRKPLLKQEEESEEDEESEESDEEDLEGLTTDELEARERCAWAKDLDGPNRPRSKSRSRSKSRLQPEPLECIGSAAQYRKELLAQSRSQAQSQSQDSESKKSQVLLATPAKTTTPNSKSIAQSSPNSTTTTPVTTTTTPTSKKKSSSTSKKRKRASTSPPSDLDSPVASASAPGQLGSNRRFGYDGNDGNDGTILSASQPLPARKSLFPLIRYTPSIAGYAVHYGS